MLQVTGQGLHPILAGEYHDRFAGSTAAWRFTERIFDPRLFGDLSTTWARSLTPVRRPVPAADRAPTQETSVSNQPTLVVLGASGDLAARLLFPALLSLEHRERLEDLRIIGYARQEWTTDQFHENLRAAIDMHGVDVRREVLRQVHRPHRVPRRRHLGRVAARACKSVLDGPAIFYLALPPGVFADAAETIAKAGLADETNGLAPARDREAVRHRPRRRALALNEQLHKVLARRPDLPHRPLPRQGDGAEHARVPVREPVHRARAATPAHVDEIQITVAETLGVEGRSRYYDGIGALRDMIQNHLIQMMTFATMEPPALWDAEMIRDHKVEVLKSVRRVDPEIDAVRGQYTAGLVEGEPRIAYRAEPGVDPDVAHRHVRRGAAARRHVALGRRARAAAVGQAAGGQGARGRVPVPEPPTRLFRHTPLEHAEPNWLVFRMSPTECTELVVRTKQPGLELEARESVLRADYADRRTTARRRAYESVAARRARRRPHAVPALRRGRVVVAHRRPDPRGVEARRARGLRRGQ